MDDRLALRALAKALGVHTEYVDGIGQPVEVQPETLVAVCKALGAAIDGVRDAPSALSALSGSRDHGTVPPVLVAWDGVLELSSIPDRAQVHLVLEDGQTVVPRNRTGTPRLGRRLPLGVHHLAVEMGGTRTGATVLSAPLRAWRRPGPAHGWGVAAHMAALRSDRSRSVGDVRDLETLGRWAGERGGNVVSVLPLLPTFNTEPAEPSPYSPVSRLFWSELVLDVGPDGRERSRPERLDLDEALAEVRRALAQDTVPPTSEADEELMRYSLFRGAQARHGRDWRTWPARLRSGRLRDDDVDPDEARFHLVAQTEARRQLRELVRGLESSGVRLGLDMAVGSHPDGYDPWSRQHLFAEGVSVGSPPDPGFPSGQDWGFAPALPEASRREGHQYFAAALHHQASMCGVLRVDHVMALSRLYWIPHGMSRDQGTYVSYPAEELFAVLTLGSVRNECEIVGENLGTVPSDIDEALTRHGIWGMYVAQYGAADLDPEGPGPDDVAVIGTHDMATLVGWTRGTDIEERVRYGLTSEDVARRDRARRTIDVERLAARVGAGSGDPARVLEALLDWLGRSEAPLVLPWLEDLWLEASSVNLPGTSSRERPNWQRPIGRSLDDVLADSEVDRLVRLLDRARSEGRTGRDERRSRRLDSPG